MKSNSKPNANSKTSTVVILDRNQAEIIMAELVRSENQRRHLIARLDAAILKIQEAAAPEITARERDVNTRSEALRAWAESNPKEFAGNSKYIPLLSGRIGFRVSPPRLALLSRAFTWDGVTELLRTKGWCDFIRTRTELDKLSLLAQRECRNLNEVGLKVVQDKSFYVEPHLTNEQCN